MKMDCKLHKLLINTGFIEKILFIAEKSDLKVRVCIC